MCEKNIEAIILAAGESRRMGQLKPLLKIDGKTVLYRIVEQLKKADITIIHIVVGYQAEQIINKAGVFEHFVVNEHYLDGQFSSLQKGLAAASVDCEGVIVCLADQPQIRSTWIRQLTSAMSGSTKIVRLSFKGRTGHPILYAQELLQEIMKMPATATAKVLMSKYVNETEFVEIDSDAILYDADTPEDFEAIKKLVHPSGA